MAELTARPPASVEYGGRDLPDSAVYVLTARCSNCGWSGSLRIARGAPVPSSYRGAKCPTCDCTSVYAVPRGRRRP